MRKTVRFVTLLVALLVASAAYAQSPQSSILTTLSQLRAELPATLSDDQCADLLNVAAWLHRDEGWGLSNKTSGTRGTRHDGAEVCHDVLMFADGRYWDVLTGAGPGGPSSVISSLGPPGRITDPARGWVAPIPPKGSTSTGSGSGGGTGGSGTVTQAQLEAVVAAAVAKALKEQEAILQIVFDQHARATHQQIAEMLQALEPLAGLPGRLEELAEHFDEVLSREWLVTVKGPLGTYKGRVDRPASVKP